MYMCTSRPEGSCLQVQVHVQVERTVGRFALKLACTVYFGPDVMVLHCHGGAGAPWTSTSGTLSPEDSHL